MEYRSKTAHECYHCKQWVEAGEPHDCWTTTEAALTRDLSEDLREAWERLRETAAEFGEQRIYASHHCIMFSRRACYFFVRPKTKVLELCIFLGRTLISPRVRRVQSSSKAKVSHIVHVAHRDEVEPPLTDWLREAFDVSEALSTRNRTAPKAESRTGRSRSRRAKPAARPSARQKEAAARPPSAGGAKGVSRLRATSRPPRRAAKPAR
jgi:hypothetical protein